MSVRRSAAPLRFLMIEAEFGRREQRPGELAKGRGFVARLIEILRGRALFRFDRGARENGEIKLIDDSVRTFRSGQIGLSAKHYQSGNEVVGGRFQPAVDGRA